MFRQFDRPRILHRIDDFQTDSRRPVHKLQAFSERFLRDRDIVDCLHDESALQALTIRRRPGDHTVDTPLSCCVFRKDDTDGGDFADETFAEFPASHQIDRPLC